MCVLVEAAVPWSRCPGPSVAATTCHVVDPWHLPVHCSHFTRGHLLQLWRQHDGKKGPDPPRPRGGWRRVEKCQEGLKAASWCKCSVITESFIPHKALPLPLSLTPFPSPTTSQECL